MKSLLVLLFCGLIGVIFYLFLNKTMKKKVAEANAKAKNKQEIFLENESAVKNFNNKKLSVFLIILNILLSLLFIIFGIIGIYLFYEKVFVSKTFNFSDKNSAMTIIAPLVIIWGILNLIDLFKKSNKNSP